MPPAPSFQPTTWTRLSVGLWLNIPFSRPLIRTYQFSVDATSAVHVLPADFITRHITKVELYNADPDLIIELTHYAYNRDEQWIVETQFAVDAGEVLQISYSAVHTIDDLDSAAGTTVPDADETLLELGAAGHAASHARPGPHRNHQHEPRRRQSLPRHCRRLSSPALPAC